MTTASYLIQSALLITAGVIIANIVLESDSMRKLSPLIRPFCRASNLPKEGAVSLFASFFNPTAGKSTLAGFYHGGKIGDKETILTLVMSTFPVVAGESLFRVHVPIALVLLGPFIGSIYIVGDNAGLSEIQSFHEYLSVWKARRENNRYNVSE
jgi:hypothetical protein